MHRGSESIAARALRKKKYNTLEDIDEHRDRYMTRLEEAHTNQPKSAFVTFRSMEGRERAFQAFDLGYTLRFLHYFCFCCCFKQRTEDKRFNGRFLRVKRAVDPELIIWGNYGFSRAGIFCRRLMYYIFQLSILIASYYAVLVLENRNIELEATVPNAACPSETLEADAYNDWLIQPASQRTGSFHCFCKGLYDVSTEGATEYEFSQDGEKHCAEWLSTLILVLILGLVIPAAVGTLNVILEVALMEGSDWCARPHNVNETIRNSVRGISII